VASAIRKRIVEGEFVPGSQLPTWDAMGAEYGVGRNTLVRAIEQLKQQRFIYAASTRGTYVVDRPPHLFNYVLLFHDKPGHEEWSQFYWALANQSVEIQEQRNCRITARYGVQNERDNDPHERLLREVATDQYAGVIFVGNPDRISTQCLMMSSLPKVAICGRSDRFQLPDVDIDRSSFVRKAVDFLASRGRRKIAVLSHYHDPVLKGLGEAIQQKGLEYRPHWMLPATALLPETANPIIRLLLSAAQPEQPDALIIANDNLVDEALAAVVALGKRVPEDLEIVTHCNWPTPKGHVIHTHRLGYDVRRMLRECIQVIDDWRAGKETPECVRTPALFENEL